MQEMLKSLHKAFELERSHEQCLQRKTKILLRLLRSQGTLHVQIGCAHSDKTHAIKKT